MGKFLSLLLLLGCTWHAAKLVRKRLQQHVRSTSFTAYKCHGDVTGMIAHQHTEALSASGSCLLLLISRTAAPTRPCFMIYAHIIFVMRCALCSMAATSSTVSSGGHRGAALSHGTRSNSSCSGSALWSSWTPASRCAVLPLRHILQAQDHQRVTQVKKGYEAYL